MLRWQVRQQQVLADRRSCTGGGDSRYTTLGIEDPLAVEGTKLQVMYMNELYPVTVERASATPLFDPADKRMKS